MKIQDADYFQPLLLSYPDQVSNRSFMNYIKEIWKISHIDVEENRKYCDYIILLEKLLTLTDHLYFKLKIVDQILIWLFWFIYSSGVNNYCYQQQNMYIVDGSRHQLLYINVIIEHCKSFIIEKILITKYFITIIYY